MNLVNFFQFSPNLPRLPKHVEKWLKIVKKCQKCLGKRGKTCPNHEKENFVPKKHVPGIHPSHKNR